MRFPELRALSLRGQRLGPEGVAGLVSFEFPRLEALDLGGAIRGRECSSGALNWLAYARRPHLKRLNLDGWRVMRAYSRAEAAKIALACPSLEALSLNAFRAGGGQRCSRLCDEALRAIAAELPALRELELSGLSSDVRRRDGEPAEPGLSPGGVRELLSAMRGLHTLRLTVGVPLEDGRPLWPELFEAAAHLREYAPHTRSSAVCMEPGLCPAADDTHVFRAPVRALHDFESDRVGDV